MTTNETAIQTISDFIRAAVQQRADAIAAAEAEERTREERAEQGREARRAAVEAQVIQQLPEILRPFAHVPAPSGYYCDRVLITLPDCAPFGIVIENDVDGARLDSRRFFKAYASVDNSGDFEPGLYMHERPASSTLEAETANAYEALRVYNEALDMWQHAQAERKHANAMSERESALRHEEEPEPPARLAWLSGADILTLVEDCIRDMEDAGEERERYLYRRAMALSAYVSARESSYIGRSSAE